MPRPRLGEEVDGAPGLEDHGASRRAPADLERSRRRHRRSRHHRLRRAAGTTRHPLRPSLHPGRTPRGPGPAPAREAESLAARWAAKEAVIKAWSSTRYGHPEVIDPSPVDLREIEVRTDAWGRPAIRLHGAIADRWPTTPSWSRSPTTPRPTSPQPSSCFRRRPGSPPRGQRRLVPSPAGVNRSGPARGSPRRGGALGAGVPR